ncbi:uncharacterized protein CLUP02_15700 [Colletotrichum lupini]|uniref:Uncharacterized protein n=1 Tax=Colletotrichum lupini TaxID=145971 RepID=A0A9Q8WPG7_9PEZI|nr:uncharacterized protein CLUP02_15700 [Colletotrichum lupini]UQC90170.1 hypothetical protein CLUP02_15700 [Colletotrichum lupini]
MPRPGSGPYMHRSGGAGLDGGSAFAVRQELVAT